MREQDEDLVQIIRELQEAKGRGEIFDPRRLSEKIEILGPSIELSALRSNISAEIVDRIGVSWDEWYGRLTLYKDREGHCSVPAEYKTPDDYRLGQWVRFQRVSQNKLSSERKIRLDKLAFDWDPITTQWEEGFEHLQAYVKEYKHCRVPAQYKTPDGYRLGQWVVFQRVSRNKLSSERKARLDALGFDWAPHDTAWEDGLEHCRAFVTEHRHCRVPPEYKSPDGYKLGQWVIRRRSKKDALSAEQVAILDALGFDWDPITTQWQEGFEHLQAYVKEYKDCRVPQQYKSPDGYRLGQWVSEQRHNRDTRSPERKPRLDALGFVWDEREAGWEEGFSYLKAYKEREGYYRVPAKHKTPDGYRLGQWVSIQRLSQAKLTSERKARLDALGFDWAPHDTAWEEGFSYLKAYKEREGHCRVPQAHKENGYRLGQWVGIQRTDEKKLYAERRQRLNELGFVWDVLTAQWEEGFDNLKVFQRREGHCRVPQKHKENGYRLGQWVGVQRTDEKKLSAERRQRLDELGFVWDVLTAQWEEGFDNLKVFQRREGHCRVPISHVENSFRLGTWVNTQRQRKARMSQERIQRLDKLGFVWKVR